MMILIVNTRGNQFPYKTEAEENWTPWGDDWAWAEGADRSIA